MAENGRYESVSQKLDRLEERLQQMAVNVATLTANSNHMRDDLTTAFSEMREWRDKHEERLIELREHVEAELKQARSQSWGILQWSIAVFGVLIVNILVTLITMSLR